VAQKSFLEEGYAGTTMSAVSAALGGSKSTLWQHFPSKLELFTAVIDRLAKNLHLDVTDILNSQSGFEIKISNFCKKYIALICSPTVISFQRLIISEVNHFPEIGKTFFSQAFGITRIILSDFIRQFMLNNFDCSTDSDAAAEFLISLCHGQCFRNLIFGLSDFVSEDEMNHDVEFSIKAFMNIFGEAINLSENIDIG
jgi:AcrR family transcriptional regulator